MLLVGLISTIPSRIQMVIEMAHLDLKLLDTIALFARKVPNGLVELLSGFT
jgi:hypothetical protein